jgi:hypothetical protein
MASHQKTRKSKALWGLICVALVVQFILHIRSLATGIPEVDGMLVLSIGFYICSRAAANFLNAILYESILHRWKTLARADVLWLGLNALVMLSGFSLVITGLYRFFSRSF